MKASNDTERQRLMERLHELHSLIGNSEATLDAMREKDDILRRITILDKQENN